MTKPQMLILKSLFPIITEHGFVFVFVSEPVPVSSCVICIVCFLFSVPPASLRLTTTVTSGLQNKKQQDNGFTCCACEGSSFSYRVKLIEDFHHVLLQLHAHLFALHRQKRDTFR